MEIRLENILPFDPARSYPICIGGKRTGPPEHCVGAWAYLEWRDQYVFHPPLEDLSLLADAVSRFLESGESAVNQVISKRIAKKQQMQWSRRRAHLLLQVRTQVLNEELGETIRSWYPGFRRQAEGAVA